ncbi:mucin-5B-like [Harpia harpyja]|uniref:mucin-5B-like n=1 Tax=Harpia harpyja TaxID=202280 RepID=UPI0022B1C83E|nr:mucin-5B-like [Harpia harpyja]
MKMFRSIFVISQVFANTSSGAQTEIQQEPGSKYTEVVQQKQNISSKVNIIQPMLTNPVITSSNPAHNGRVCSTWGNFHFKTFDGDIFSFPGLCNYVFASHCNAPYEDFNIQIRRTVVENAPTINRITMKLEGVAAELTKDVVMINSNRVQLPYSQSGIMIEKSSIYVKVASKMGIVLMWNEDDSILLELNEKYANQTCGLCGDFNGFPIYNEFYSNNIKMTPLQFGNMQKMDGPTEHCEESTSTLPDNCTDNSDDICQKTLTSSAFAECNDLVDVREYIMACQDDLCRSEESKNASCICDTFAEYSRQCAHAGGHPLNWRTSKLCSKKCPSNMQYQECSSPCADTCTNPERSEFCEEHCMDGCFCPPGTVFDDINNSGCIPPQQCSCVYNGKTYATGTSFSEQCHSCTCNGGQWSCQDMSCPGTCSLEGGSHISTYDKKHYSHHGDCTYVLSKHCKDETFTILVELRKCGLTDTETCLRTVTLNMNKGQTLIEVKPDGGVFMNSIYTQLPISAANATVFRPSSFFIIMQTNFGVHLEIQIIPIMQVFVRLNPIFKDQTCGLCGNFNNIQTDDFRVMSGIIEGTATAFANTWKTQASCPNIQHSFENPCALSIDNEKYAQHWCGLLTDSKGPFADCHYAVNPSVYHTNCMFDTCNCENSEDCLCAALSSYVRACAAKGLQLRGWRTDVCSKYSTSCPKSLNYSYTIASCQPTCRSLSDPDVTCNIKFVPVDGCTCVDGTYMDENGKCVPANECPCYYRRSPIPLGEVVHENGLVCTCIQGRLNCIGAPNPTPVCESPMVYFDCRNITAGATGAECQKSCQTLDMQCYSTQCVSGCMCPAGLVLDGNGGCIPEEECPCIHNEAMYQPEEKINVDCNTCVCKNRKWECTKDQCLGTCVVYGDGHYNTFDDKRFSFNGNCEYTLVQDHCGKSGTANGTFRVITENIPCGNTGTTCSKSIKVFLESYELILGEEHVSVIKRGQNDEVPYTVRYMGMYLVIETTSGLILMWDKKTSIFIKLSPDFKGQICGLCGNYDGNGINDFTTRSQSVVENVLEFGNSWKVSSTCPDAYSIKDPCSTNLYRKSWSEKQCSIINSNIFAACHSQVEPAKYYQACVTDACACDTGGDCDCFCTAVAAYARACSEVGVCIAWRTPSICPLFCDYYNQQGECEWHYKPCGASCMKTCRNPSGKCIHNLPGLEGCYPNCPPNKPYFHEDQMKCVSLCDCYDNEDGKIYRRDECHVCECTSEGLQCKFDDKETTTATPVTTVCVKSVCAWSEWYDSTHPEDKEDSGDDETFENLRAKGYTVCENPNGVQCRAKNHPDTEIYNLNQTVQCNQSRGLICNNKDQQNKQCYNYEIRISCCSYKPCSEIQTTTLRNTKEFTTTTAVKSTPLTINTKIKQTQTQRTEAQKTEVPKTSIEHRESTTHLTETSVTENTSQVSTTGYQTTATPSEITTVGTQKQASPTTATSLSQPARTTTTATTVVPSNTAPPIQGTTVITTTSRASTAKTSPPLTESTTTIITPTPTAPTSASSTTSTSRTTTPTTTTSKATSVPTKTSSVKTQTPTSPTTATSLSQPARTTTTATTVVPSNTAQPIQGTTVITTTSRASTTKTSPSLTGGTTTVITSTPTASTSPTTFTASTSKTTTSCLQHCAWTQWFDLDSPSPGSQNGDIETLAKIRAAGYALCDEPQDIMCRAKDYRNRSLDKLGQKIECSLDTGLVCRNKDQIKKYPMCFDYEIKVLCCDRNHCETTSETTGTTAGFSTTSALAETSTTNTKTPAPPTTASTLPQTAMTTATASTVVPSNTAPPIQGTTVITTTSRASTAKTSPPLTESTTTIITPTPTAPTSASSTTSTSRTTTPTTTTSKATSVPTKTSSVKTQTPTSPTTATSLSQPARTTTTATTVVPSNTAPPIQGTTVITTTSRASTAKTSPPLTESTTTIITPTPTAPTSASSTTSTSRTTTPTTTPTTTTSKATSVPTKTSSVKTQTPTSPTTATSLSQPARTTTTATTVVPSNTAQPIQGTTVITTTSRASTTKTSPSLTGGTTTVITSTPTASTSPTTFTASTSKTTTSCLQHCAWTQWFDLDSPSPGSQNGDIETLAKIRAAGYALCDEPQDIMCRAKDYRNRSLDKLGQKIECSLDTGLVCRNKDQIKKYPMCFDYEIKVLCCDRNHCETTSETTGTTAGFSTTSALAETSTTNTKTPAPPTTASTLPQTAMTTATASTVVPSNTAPPIQGTTVITTTSRASTAKTSPPLTESTTTIITPTPTAPTSASSTTSTSRTTTPTTTTSKATSVPTKTSSVKTQTPTSPTTATSLSQPARTTTTATTVVPSNTAPPIQGTTVITTTSRASTAKTSPPLTESTTTIITPTPTAPTSASSTTSTSRTTTPTTTTSKATSVPTKTSSVKTQTPTSPTTATSLSQPARTTTTATTVVPSNTAQPIQGTTVITTTSRASTTKTSPSLTGGTTTVITSTPTASTSPTTFTASTSKTTTSCLQHCAWTQWFDLDSPSPGSQNGDIETLAKIRAAGYALCDEPQDIMCRAKDYRNRSLDKLGQKIECSLDTGLVCRNKDQIKKYPMCFDYEIKVLCCDRNHCETTSETTGTTAGFSTTSALAETSTTNTKTPAPPTTASTLPQTAMTTATASTVVPSNTAPPIQGTTVITTTSRASTAKTSPPLTESTTTIITPTPTAPTSASSTTSTSRTTTPTTTTSKATSVPTKTSSVKTQTPTSPTTATSLSQPARTTTTATTVVPSNTAPPIQGTTVITTTSRASTAKTSPPLTESTTTIITPTPTAPTSASSTTSTSRTTTPTTTPTTTTSKATSVPTKTSSVKTQTPTSPTTATSLSQPARTTTTATTVVPSNTAQPIQGTTVITTTSRASTTKTSPSLTGGTTTVITSTPTASTSPTTFTASTSKTTTSCLQHCAWTQWFDLDSPSPGSQNGDIETLAKIRAAGYALCDEPQDIMCRAKDYRNRSLDKLGQKIECSLDTGLVCRNKDQIKKYPMCFDYEIKVLCCDRNHCETTSETTGTTAGFSTTSALAETSTTNTKTPAPPTTASTLPQTAMTTATASTVVPSNTAPPIQGTTVITTTSRASTAKTSPPLTESTTTIITPTPTAPTSASSTTSTSRTTTPTTTTSKATSVPTKTSSVKTQTPTSPTTATSLSQPARTTTTATTVVPSNTAPPIQGTTVITTTSRASTAKTSPPLTESTTTIITPTPTAPTSASSTTSTSRTTTPTTTTSKATSVPTKTSSVKTQTPTSPTTATSLSQPARTTTTATTVVPSNTAPPIQGTTVITTTSRASTTKTSPSLTGGTTTVITSTPTASTSPTTFTASTSKTTTSCLQHCAWTQWFDLDSPSPGSQNGDIETLAKIRAAGYALCDEPQDIMCRAKDYRNRSLDKLGQKIECSLDTGLVCRNKDQIKKYPMCFDYEIKVLCCDRNHCETTSETTGTTAGFSTTSALAETSTTNTKTPAPPTTASTLPQTAMTTATASTVVPSNTAPPIQGTTVITTTSRASTAKTPPPLTESTTTILTPTPTAPTSASSTTSTSRTTTTTTTTFKATSAPAESSTVATHAPISPTTASTPAHLGIRSTIVSTDILLTSVSLTGQSTATIVFPTSLTTTSSPVATTGTPQSSHVTASTSAAFSSSHSTPVITEASTYVTSSRTTPCFCHVFGNLFSPGEVVYNRTDRAGCNFYALCSKECEIHPFQGPCYSTTPFTSGTSETTAQATSSTEHVFSSVSPTTATSLTTSVERNCTDVNPPRKPGENWISECRKCVCDPLNATVQCQPLPCQTAQTPICDPEFAAVTALPLKDTCCPKYECRPRPDYCVINGTTYKVGASTVTDSCMNCTCTSEIDKASWQNIWHCERVQCETSCPPVSSDSLGCPVSPQLQED